MIQSLALIIKFQAGDGRLAFEPLPSKKYKGNKKIRYFFS